MIRLKNNTGAADYWIGVQIQPGEYYTLQNDLEISLAITSTKVDTDITSGSLVIASDVVDITNVTRAREWLRYTYSRRILTLRGIAVNSVFTDTGLLSGNRWLKYGSGNGTSDVVPMIISFNLQPISVEFTNQNNPTNLLIDFYRDRAGVISNLFTWDVSGKKSAYKTNNLNASYLPLDRIAVRARQSGVVQANNAIVKITFVILNETTGEGSVT